MSIRHVGLALLLSPVLASASPITIEWEGLIDSDSYTSTDPSKPTPTEREVSGVVTLDSASLPAPDSGNPDGVSSWSNGSFLSSTVHWQHGPFTVPGVPPPGGATLSSDSLSIDTTNDLCQVTNLAYGVDDSGQLTSIGAVALQFGGFSNTLLQLLSGGTAPAGHFTGGVAAFGSTDSNSQGFFASVNLTEVEIESRTVAAPEVNTEGAATALTLFGFALAVARGRRRRQAVQA